MDRRSNAWDSGPDWSEALAAEIDHVYQILGRWGAEGGDVEDLVQDVFLVVWRRRATYDPRRPLRPWIEGIALRVLQDSRRRVRPELPRGFVDVPDERARPEHHLARLQARALVRQTLGRIPDKQRKVFIRHELEGIAMRDLADAMSAPLFTLYSRLKKAKLTFAKEVRRAAATSNAPLPIPDLG